MERTNIKSVEKNRNEGVERNIRKANEWIETKASDIVAVAVQAESHRVHPFTYTLTLTQTHNTNTLVHYLFLIASSFALVFTRAITFSGV